MKNVWIPVIFAAFALSACVTINIYFPAAAAEKAADKIIEEVWQTQKPAHPTSNQAQPAANQPAAKETK